MPLPLGRTQSMAFRNTNEAKEKKSLDLGLNVTENPFCDGFQMYCIIHLCSLRDVLAKMDLLVLMTSCVCHDLDHPGFNNTWVERRTGQVGRRQQTIVSSCGPENLQPTPSPAQPHQCPARTLDPFLVRVNLRSPTPYRNPALCEGFLPLPLSSDMPQDISSFLLFSDLINICIT